MSEKYEITREAILAMAKECPEAKKMLKAGFPEAFEKEKSFNLKALKNSLTIFTDVEAGRAGFKNGLFLQVRGYGSCNEIAFFLEEDYLKWALVRDDQGDLCLTVERKG